MADAVGQRVALPSIGHLDIEKIKREGTFYHYTPPATSTLNMQAPPLVSPSIYSGPPPPYSYPSSAASSMVGGDRGDVSAGHKSYISPPETRRTSGDEKESNNPPKHSLPSITEALNKDQQPISISSLLSSSGPIQKPALVNQSPTSPTARSRFLNNVPKGPPDSFSHYTPSSYRPQTSTEPPNRPLYSPATTTPVENRFPAINSIAALNSYDHHHPTQPPRHASPPTTHGRPGASPVQHSQAMSPPRERMSQTTGPSSASKYASYQPAAYSYPPTTPGISSYNPPTLQQSPWQSIAQRDRDRDEDIRKAVAKSSPSPTRATYGESVKRHLDNFDLETSLNEIAEGSGRALDFSRLYGNRAHQTQRSGQIPGSVPTLAECDDMIRQQTKVMDAMSRIREVICKQQEALFEQRKYDQQNYKPPASEADDDLNSYHEKLEGSGGFAGSDSKKRRGRAAPPGRCHSCNRAETPEWRRGPDGARTLCNACGLHYAKLTRKMGSKAPVGPSALRPKETTSSSP